MLVVSFGCHAGRARHGGVDAALLIVGICGVLNVSIAEQSSAHVLTVSAAGMLSSALDAAVDDVESLTLRKRHTKQEPLDAKPGIVVSFSSPVYIHEILNEENSNTDFLVQVIPFSCSL